MTHGAEMDDALAATGRTHVLLSMLRLGSAALPIGNFAYSQGLESAIAAGAVRNAPEAEAWICGVLEHSILTCDAPLLARMHAALSAQNTSRIDELDDRWRAMRATRELRDEDRQLGASLRRLLVRQSGASMLLRSVPAQPTFGTAFSLAALMWGLDTCRLVSTYCFTWCETQLSAATRLVPLGQSDAQVVMSRLLQVVSAGIARSLSLRDEEITSTVPGLALHSTWHESLYTRLFRS